LATQNQSAYGSLALDLGWIGIALFNRGIYAALAMIFAAWLRHWLAIEHAHPQSRQCRLLWRKYRREWMAQMVTRQPRIFVHR